MLIPSLMILYVEDPLQSADFYCQLFGIQPIEKSSSFSLLRLYENFNLGLWLKNEVHPPSKQERGGSEISVAVASKREVDEVYEKWQSRKVTMIQGPVDRDFGYSFVACDPDLHRIRVYKLNS